MPRFNIRRLAIALVLGVFFTQISCSKAQANNTAHVASWSPDGKMLAIGTDSNLILISPEGKFIASHDTTEKITALTWNPNGKQIATASGTRLLELWNIASDKAQILNNDGASNPVITGSVSYSPDGSRLAGVTSSAVVIWSSSTGKVLAVPKTDGHIYTVAWAPDGNHLAMGGERSAVNNGTAQSTIQVIIWDTKKMQLVAQFDPPLDITNYVGGSQIIQPAKSVQWIKEANDTALSIVTMDNTFVGTWEPRTGKIKFIDLSFGPHTKPTGALGYSPDGQLYAVGTLYQENETVAYVHVERSDGSCLENDPCYPSQDFIAGKSPVESISWSTDGKTFAVVEGDGQVYTGGIDALSGLREVWPGISL